ncbi:MAG: transcriptional repressor [Terrimicrobiaceae bacterium]|nr:transcriptional repressor [Terrimicrobiaceae bacterium]
MTSPESRPGRAARGGGPTPTPSAFSPAGILSSLKTCGLRVTKSRRQILEVLFAAGRPLSLEDIREQARRRGASPDYATVFRTIALLEARGIVHKVNLQRSRSYFELQDPSRHYDHLVCTGCGRVVVLDEPCPLTDFEKELARRHGFRQVHHSLEFFGRCGRC